MWWIDSFACLAVRSLGACLCVLPVEWALWLGRRAGDLMYLVKPARARLADVNLAWALPRYTPAQRRRIVREAFRSLGQSGAELLRLPRVDQRYVERYITVRGKEHLDAAIARGRGIIFLTGHFGNWELSSIVGALTGYPMVALAREQKFPRLYRLLNSYREAKGCRVVGKGMALRAMVRELKANRIVGIVGDQGAKTQGVRVTLFGRDALTPAGPVELAVRMGAAVLPTFIRRTRGPYHVIDIEPPLDVAARAGESPERVVQRGLQQFMDRLAVHIREAPEQWLWMHRRWKSTTRRHALVLSDGKAGHVKQSLAVVEALRVKYPALTHEVIEITYRSPVHRLVATLSTWMPGPFMHRLLPFLLVTHDARRTMHDDPFPPCDYAISCGAATAPVNLLLAREWLAKPIVIMRPSLVPLRAFALALIPVHDRPPRRANIVPTLGAVTALTAERLAEAQRALLARAPVTASPEHRIGVLLGGDSDDVRWPAQRIAQSLEQLERWCRAQQDQLLVTTSRRTSRDVEALCVARLQGQSWCPVLIVANNGNIEGAVEGIVGASRLTIVTAESASMIAEAVASGRPVVALLPDEAGLRRMRPKRRALLASLQARGAVRVATASSLAATLEALRAAPARPQRSGGDALRDAVSRL